MSLSAPELGAIIPPVEVLKLSASSSELLHERAMIRFYQSALAEEAELEKARQKANGDRKPSVEIPKIQINSKDDEDIVGLERKQSLRRRLSAGGGIGPNSSILWAQRRRSLKLSTDISDLLDYNPQKEKLTAQEKRNLMLTRERSASEELEEQEFERVRERMKLEKQSSTERRSIEVAKEEKWDAESNEEDEYEVSISEEETESSEDERLKEYQPRKPRYVEEEEEEPYHPGMIRNAFSVQAKYDLPFEILTKPNPLPDPNFVPKPILKKRDYEEAVIRPPAAPILKRKEPTLRGMEEKEAVNLMQRNRSSSLTEGEDHFTPRQRSFSLIPQATGNVSPPPKRSSFSTAAPTVIKAVAEISSFTAAGVVIPEPLLNKKKSEEEIKVVADHYGDIVKSFGHRKRDLNQSYTDRDALKKVAEMQENFTAELSETESAAHATPLDDRSVSSSKEEVAQVKQLSKEIVIPSSNPVTASQPEETTNQRKSSLTLREDRSSSRSPHRFRKSQSRTPSKSPVRAANWHTFKNVEDNSLEYSRNRPRKPRTPSSSLSPARRARPMLKEIMTQTSIGLEMHPAHSRVSTPTVSKHEEIVAAAKVRTLMDYTTDLAMLAVACYLYLFSNELLAVPVLLVLVYRQLKDELKRRLPEWLPKKYKDKKN